MDENSSVTVCTGGLQPQGSYSPVNDFYVQFCLFIYATGGWGVEKGDYGCFLFHSRKAEMILLKTFLVFDAGLF